MPKYIILPQAKAQIFEILENVSEFTGFGSSSDKLLKAFLKKFELISDFPLAIGRARDDGTREAFERRYRIIYQQRENEVVILAVIHSSRIYPQPK